MIVKAKILMYISKHPEYKHLTKHCMKELAELNFTTDNQLESDLHMIAWRFENKAIEDAKKLFGLKD